MPRTASPAKRATKAAKKTAKPAKKIVKKATKKAKTAARRVTGKRVYFFGPSGTEGKRDQKLLLGGKGANLADMTTSGFPVPPGFTITTETCAEYNSGGKKLPAGLMDEVAKNVRKTERATGKKFGNAKKPLLLSVRSGAAVSMPGMMDTVLNLGLTDEIVEAMAKTNDRFAYDSYRRLINMYGDVVVGVHHHYFEEAISAMKKARGVEEDTDLTADDLKKLCGEYKKVFKKHAGFAFPQNPEKQLELAIEAVFKSWDSDKAISYRRAEGIGNLAGTAVNCQTMVFGNMGDDCATGVGFTRDPSSGENKFLVEYLVNAQGEDVVAGIRTPKGLTAMKKELPAMYKELMSIRERLEKRYRDMQDFEFTLEQGTFYMLQTRNGKRTGRAALKIATDLLKEKKVDQKQAVRLVTPGHLDQLLHPAFQPAARKSAKVLTSGLNASPGAAVGKLAFTAQDAKQRAESGEAVILVRRETSPEDVDGMHAAQGILTSTGGKTSHAAVVARGWGKPCVCGAGAVEINASKETATINGKVYGPGDFLSIDGTTGDVLDGEVPTQDPEPDRNFKKLMTLADKFRKLNVRTNADTPADSKKAREFGAEGIGLCRTEHMFFEPERIGPMREMILATTTKGREKALKKLLPFQRKDFAGLFKAMKGLPVTIRLLDPPLHEFLPGVDQYKEIELIATNTGVTPDEVRSRITALHESNPMLGHRGCRLAVTYPEILRMQVRAILEAALQVGGNIVPEIMIPLAGTDKELSYLIEHLHDEAQQVFKAKKKKCKYLVGTMIEVPRAAITADQIAAQAEFFSFGTNDLTQMTFGYSRDDAGVFLREYVDKGILPEDPFQSLDQSGVGEMVRIGVEKGRAARKGLKLGICGEHGGDPSSVHFCHEVGLDYVSCSPFRVPIARLAAAHAALK
ncbi:MAG: pyruvate, phosphate dikinase [Planctomycetota bacterium]